MARRNLGGVGATCAARRFDIADSMLPRWAAEGGLGFGDLVPAAWPVCFVVGTDSAVLSMADAAQLAGPGVTKVAVLHRFESGPAMAEWLTDQGSRRHHDGIPEFRVLRVQVVVDVAQPHAIRQRSGRLFSTFRSGSVMSLLICLSTGIPRPPFTSRRFVVGGGDAVFISFDMEL